MACGLTVLLVLQEAKVRGDRRIPALLATNGGREAPAADGVCARLLVIIGVGPGHALLVHLPQRPPVASAMPLLNLLLLRRRIGTAASSSSPCAAIAAAPLMMGVGGGRRQRRRRGSGELLHDGAELGGVDDVHRRGRGVPAPPVRRPPAAGSVLLAGGAAAALHQGRQQTMDQ